MAEASEQRSNMRRMLGDLQVLEVGTGAAGSYCGSIFASSGADVIRVIPPPSHATQFSPLFAFLNRGKRAATLDLRRRDGRLQFQQLVKRADIIIETLPPEPSTNPCLPYSRLARVNNGIVLTSISPFGRSGPYAQFAAEELVIEALGGFLYGVGDPEREPLGGAPFQSELLAGVAAHFATMVALLARNRDGLGQHVDVSGQATVATLLEGALTMASYNGWTWRRSGHRRTVSYHPVANYACKDGYVSVSVLEEREWRALCELLQCHDLAHDQRLSSPDGRLQHADEIDRRIEHALQDWSRFEFYHAAQTLRLACGPVVEAHELCGLPQLRAREFCDETSGLPTLPFLVDGLRLMLRREDSASTEANNDPGTEWFGVGSRDPSIGLTPSQKNDPLVGLRVLDCTHSWAGPLATRMLASFGAEVIHVESPRRPDRWRGPIAQVDEVSRTHRYPDRDPGDQPYNRNALFNEMNTNKVGVALDLASTEGKQLFRRLVEVSDVVVTNFSPRAARKLGLDAQSLRSARSDIISVSITGFGETGPDADYLAWGTTIEAMSGASSLKGYADDRPLLSNMAYGDPVGGFYAATAIMNALWQREFSGQGCHIDLSLLEATSALLLYALVEHGTTGRRPIRCGNRHPTYAPRGCYPCLGDDQWIAIAIRSDQEWRALVDAMGRPRWAMDDHLSSVGDRRARHDYVDVNLAQWTRARNRDELMYLLQARGVPAGSVLSNVEVLSDAQLQARRYFTTLRHPSCGDHAYPGLPFLLSRTPGAVKLPAPKFGQHNSETLSRLLGLDETQVFSLRRKGIVSDRPI